MTPAEKELARIRTDRGASYFWITETQARAKRIDALVKSGVLVRRRDDPGDRYPWCVFDVVEAPIAK